MGSVHPGVPKDLLLQLTAKYPVEHFIETGTLLGDTAAWAAEHFAHVVTIEADATHHARAAKRFAGNRRIEVILGASHQVLPNLLPKLTGRAVFWLDGHWSGEGTAGEDCECPVLDEIAAIYRWGTGHIVLVDDARMFMAPPKPPHKMDAWPDLAEVAAALAAAFPRPYVGLVEDVIFAIPSELRAVVGGYVHRAPPAKRGFFKRA